MTGMCGKRRNRERTIQRRRRLYADALEIGGEASTNTRLLGGGVDGDKDEVSLTDALVDVGREEEVPAACLADDVLQAGLVDGEVEVGGVPRVDTGLVKVDDGDLDLRALECDDGTRRASDVACADWGEGRVADQRDRVGDGTGQAGTLGRHALQQILVTFTGAIVDSVTRGWWWWW